VKRFVQYLTTLLVLLMLGAVGALSPARQGRLATARDGADHREPAFDALVEHFRGVTPGDLPGEIRLNPDWQRLIDDPASSRGEVFRVSGVIQQQVVLDPPHGDVTEWFVRDDRGTPVIVYVVGLDLKQKFHDGQRILIDARFYKRMDWLARDGQLHRYAALVGARPQHQMTLSSRTPPSQDPWRFVTPIASLVGVLSVMFFLIRIMVKRRKPASSLRSHSGKSFERLAAGVDGDEPLPDDPAAALAELKRRADAT
jgi:hypothetical protein